MWDSLLQATGLRESSDHDAKASARSAPRNWQYALFDYMKGGGESARRIRHRELLSMFKHFLVDVTRRSSSKGEGSSCFSSFQTKWEEKRPLTDNIYWADFRDPYGATVLDFVVHIMSNNVVQSPNFHKSCMEIIDGIIEKEPSLVASQFDTEPYKGMSVLHLACASGDLELVNKLTTPEVMERVGEDYINARMTGERIEEFSGLPPSLRQLCAKVTPQQGDYAIFSGHTPIEIALLWGIDDDKVIQIIRRLIDCGAKLTFFDPNKQFHSGDDCVYNFLHLLARTRWPKPQYAHDKQKHVLTRGQVEEERSNRVLELFMDPKSDLYDKLNHQARNYRGYTPLQVAAMFGNGPFFIALLDYSKIHVWQCGKQVELGFALHELDSGASEDEIGALELLTIYKRGNLLKLELIAAIIDVKWRKFGYPWMIRSAVYQVTLAFLTAIVCLDDTEGYHAIRWYSRAGVIFLSTSFLLGHFLLYIICARNEQFFKHMSWSRYFNDGRLSIFNLLIMRNVIEAVVMLLLVLTPPWYTIPGWRHSTTYAFWWHCAACGWWLLFMQYIIYYFELFETTGHLASSLPAIIGYDLVPWTLIFGSIFLSCGVALRVSTTGMASDDSLHTFWGTLKTLEEAVHGPDARWRTIVEGYPRLTGCIFILFIWIALIMMTLLIAMFTTRYDTVREHISEIFLFRRATWTLTLEKLFPQWYCDYFHTGIGIELGGTAIMDRVMDAKDEEGGIVVRRVKLHRGSSLDFGDTGEKESLLKKERERWFLWRGGMDKKDMRGSADKWRDLVRPVNYFSLG